MVINYKLIRLYLKLSIILFIVVLFYSCDFLMEPMPFVNNQVHPPVLSEVVTKPAILSNYSDSQIVGDTVSTELITDIDPSNILQINLWIDTIFVETKNQASFIFSFNSQHWQNGEHILSFCVYRQKKIEGLFGLSDTNSLLVRYCIKLIFHHSPLPPTNVRVLGGGSHPYIYWDVPLEADVKFFVIRRNGVTVLDTLFNPSIYFYEDSGYNYTDIRTVHYDVGAGNEYGINFSKLNTWYY